MSLLFRSQERVSAAKLNRLAALQAAAGSGGGGGGGSYIFSTSSATSYALTVANSASQSWVRLTAEALITVTIPANATQAIPVGTEVFFERATATTGDVQFVTADGVTINGVAVPSGGEITATLDVFSVTPRAHLVKVAANEWWASSEVNFVGGLE